MHERSQKKKKKKRRKSGQKGKLLRSKREHGRKHPMDAPFGDLALEQGQVLLPLVADHFAAGEAADRNDHACRFSFDCESFCVS